MMLYPNKRQEKMIQLMSVFELYLNNDGIDRLECTLNENATKEAKKAFDEYKKLAKEEDKERMERLFV